ncbi:hypothetical protein J6590_016402 [Homalodisca vitripennis]|nr:hypothetical protein J6590_016402 [Homalodisca vitripennis]
MIATGIYVPPAMIFPRKRMKPELYVEAPVGTLPLISDSGYMNSNIFIDWLKHFARHKKNPLKMTLFYCFSTTTPLIYLLKV